MADQQYFERLTREMETLVSDMNHRYQVQDENRSKFDIQALPPGMPRPTRWQDWRYVESGSVIEIDGELYGCLEMRHYRTPGWLIRILIVPVEGHVYLNEDYVAPWTLTTVYIEETIEPGSFHFNYQYKDEENKVIEWVPDLPSGGIEYPKLR
ncbi:hypothetical protein [Ferrimicrobium sp.]|uniref:hypothetical protein n=1 Tax=Ferrimicrobium sp. TaxID=2926050 RepID=UPI00261C81EE|nr:hypothetical protein [Ferrimicrobium sp.]